MMGRGAENTGEKREAQLHNTSCVGWGSVNGDRHKIATSCAHSSKDVARRGTGRAHFNQQRRRRIATSEGGVHTCAARAKKTPHKTNALPTCEQQVTGASQAERVYSATRRAGRVNVCATPCNGGRVDATGEGAGQSRRDAAAAAKTRQGKHTARRMENASVVGNVCLAT